MAVFIGAVKKGNERSGRFLDSKIRSFIDSLNAKQLMQMRRSLASEMRLTATKKDKNRYEKLSNEMSYINYRLEK
jgi:hypothetical protein